MTFKVDMRARKEPELEPAKHLLYALLRQDFTMVPRFWPEVSAVLPADFPLYEFITPGVSLAAPHSDAPARPVWDHGIMRFEVNGITRAEVDESQFTIPAGARQIAPPF